MKRLFGTLQWTPPDWFVRAGAKRIGFGALLVLALITVAAAGWRYYESLPQPAQVVARVLAPGITPIVDGELRPEPLIVNFSVTGEPQEDSEVVTSVARLDLVGEVLTSGITLQPNMPGQWQWLNEHELQFEPAQDWPAGQTYTLEYDQALFAPNLELADTQAEFETPGFNAEITGLEFYQDPEQRDLRKVVGTVAFSHPVNQTSLRQHVRYTMRESGKTIATPGETLDFQIHYDDLARNAYIHTTPIDIPPEENYATLSVTEGVEPAAGPSRLIGALEQNVRIPDATSYFRVDQVTSVIVRNEDDDPVQTLTIAFTDRVQTERVQQRIRAFLLPADRVVDKSTHRNFHWQSPREVTDAVLNNSDQIELSLSPTEQDAATMHSARLDLPENRYLYVKIQEGLESDGGFILANTYDAIAYIPKYPKEARIAQSGAVLPQTGSHRLTFISRGVSSLRVELGRVLSKDINHLASQTGGDIRSPYFSNYRFDQDNITSRSTHYVELDEGHPGEAVFSSLDLTEYLPQGGFYFVNVQGWDRENERSIGGSDRRFILVTDIGLLVKTNADRSIDVFVHSIATGEPMAGARIQLLGKNGIPIVERTSSPDGHAAMPSTDDFTREKTPTVFVVERDSDTVFMPYSRRDRMLQYSRFDTGGQYQQQRPDNQRLRAQLFSDRGLYRPGEIVNLAAIVKREDWAVLEGLPLNLRINDPRGQTVLDRSIRLPDGGLFDEQYATATSSPTGDYSATLYLLDDRDSRRAIGTTAFKVAEFQPDRLRIRSRIRGQTQVGWMKPGDLVCDVTLDNLFGTPAQSRRVTGNYQLRPTDIQFALHEGFVFRDPLRDPDANVQPVSRMLADTRTDEDGHAELPIDLSNYEQGIYRLNVTTEGFEEGGGRSVQALASVIVSPLDHLIGHRTQSDLSFLNRGSQHSIDYIAVDHEGTAIDLANLTLSIVEYRYVSTLVQHPNGTYAYQSIRKESEISEQSYAVQADGTTFSLPTQTPGTYAVVIRDQSGLIFSKVDFTIAGARNLAGNLERDAELQLNVNGSTFAPGEQIQLEITAPFAGTGLITIERDRVYAYKWIQSDTSTSVHTITVPKELEGNAYLNVAFVRELDSPEIYVSPLSYAVAPFSVNRDAREVQIKLDTSELVRPGEDLVITHSASKSSRIVIYAVDEGILQVAEYDTPRPLDYFLPKMALQVATHQMVDLILPDFEQYRTRAAPGGGESARLLGSNLNPFRRKTEAPVVFWSGVLDSGPEPGTVRYRVPDYFNGQLRIMAVAVADDSVGHNQASTVARAPFIITPNVLTTAVPGDEFEVNVGLANHLQGSGEGAVVTLSVTHSEHLELMGEPRQELAIDEGSEDRATFRFRALDLLGAADITFEAATAGERAASRATLSVRAPVAYVATAQSGSSDDDPVTLGFKRTMYDAFAHQRVAASASPLVLADGMLDYLEAFPHSCAEQIVSKVFPQIGFLGTGDNQVDTQRVHDAFSDTVAKLRSRQTAEGGFRFWATSSEPAEFVSIYIMHFLTDAAEAGLPVPRDMRNAGRGYLNRLAGQSTTSLAEARMRAYAIYILTRNGQVTTNHLTNLHETLERDQEDGWQRDLTASYMAATYMLLKQQALAGQLISSYSFGDNEEVNSDFDTRLGRDAQHLYLLTQHFPDRARRIESDDLQRMINPILQNRFNTLSAAYTILALNAYTRATLETDRPLLTIAVDTAAGKQQVAAASLFARSNVNNGIADVSISGAGGTDIFYVLSQTGFDTSPPQSALSEGMEISREYLDTDGNAVSEAHIGDELTVRLRIRSTGQARSNVAVVDLLPGGFEASADSVQRRQGGWSADYVDVREDRVVVYGTFGNRMTEIRYQVRVTSAGRFVTPSAFAGAMYDRSVQARTAPGSFQVQGRQ